jgi:hypothetical protein
MSGSIVPQAERYKEPLSELPQGRKHFLKSPRVEAARKLSATFFSCQTSITLDAPSGSWIPNKAKR